MQAGKLRHRVTLQKRVNHRDPQTGAAIPGWENVKKIWADVVPLSAREFVASQAVQSEVTTRITIRKRSDVTNKHRILFRGQVYNIEGVLPDPVSGLEYLTLPCSEGANDG
ncbi:head-tail adaptor protein [Rouxiella silvae]|uniref:Head-tail adaptor protein n=1 Tax=Rouxiella silvae TaxID=1646373 RepID=A0ABX3TXE1_9GAMM|nr:phage head closure protein [Rouxiella silvae]ORJ19875.1 head-tail adaptor protein [Rouxiella silvae]